MNIEKVIKKEIGEGMSIFKKWSWGLSAHTKKPLFEKEYKYKRKIWRR